MNSITIFHGALCFSKKNLQLAIVSLKQFFGILNVNTPNWSTGVGNGKKLWMECAIKANRKFFKTKKTTRTKNQLKKFFKGILNFWNLFGKWNTFRYG